MVGTCLLPEMLVVTGYPWATRSLASPLPMSPSEIMPIVTFASSAIVREQRLRWNGIGYR